MLQILSWISDSAVLLASQGAWRGTSRELVHFRMTVLVCERERETGGRKRQQKQETKEDRQSSRQEAKNDREETERETGKRKRESQRDGEIEKERNRQG